MSQGPPPLNQTFTSTNVPLDVTTGDPDPTLNITIKDVTSGVTASGTLANWQNLTCGLEFAGPSSTRTLSGCGISSMPFAYTDVLQATVTAEAAFPYEASTSSTVEVWSGSLPSNAVIQ